MRKKHDSDWPHPTMRVFWYTESITADESDYEHLHAERQSSNRSQSESGVMGRNFHELVSNVVEIASRWFSSSSGDCPLEAHRQLGQDTVLEPRSIHQQAHKVSASVQRTPALTQPE